MSIAEELINDVCEGSDISTALDNVFEGQNNRTTVMAHLIKGGLKDQFKSKSIQVSGTDDKLTVKAYDEKDIKLAHSVLKKKGWKLGKIKDPGTAPYYFEINNK